MERVVSYNEAYSEMFNVCKKVVEDLDKESAKHGIDSKLNIHTDCDTMVTEELQEMNFAPGTKIIHSDFSKAFDKVHSFKR